jgi:hypothetical protein
MDESERYTTYIQSNEKERVFYIIDHSNICELQLTTHISIDYASCVGEIDGSELQYNGSGCGKQSL